MVINYCRHCGKKLDGEYITCPSCGGLIPYDIEQIRLNQAYNDETDDEYDRVQKSEKKWFIGISLILGIPIGLILTSSFLSMINMYSFGTVDNNVLTRYTFGVVLSIITFFWGTGIIYAMHYNHVFKGSLNLILEGAFIIAFIRLFFYMIVVNLSFGWFIYLRAFLRFILRRPLLSDDKVIDLLVKDLV